jgi:hypothetical protein
VDLQANNQCSCLESCLTGFVLFLLSSVSSYWLLITLAGWSHTKHPKHCSHFWSVMHPHLSSNTPDSYSSALSLHQELLAVKQGGDLPSPVVYHIFWHLKVPLLFLSCSSPSLLWFFVWGCFLLVHIISLFSLDPFILNGQSPFT